MQEKFQPVTVYVNPVDGPAKANQVYPILTRHNRISTVEYSGRTNFAGNQLRTMAARSETNLSNIYDMIKVKTQTYLYLTNPITSNDDNIADSMKGNMIRSISNVLSQLFNETYRELDFFKMRYEVNSNQLELNTGYTSILYDYQSTLQNILLLINAYNRFISMEDVLKQMSYGNESVQVNELYALTRRNTLKGKIDAIANYVLQEFVD